MLRFDANLSFLYEEADFYDRFHRARQSGFSHVEFACALAYDLDSLTQAVQQSGLGVVQFNFLDGDVAAGERGVASHPDRRADWRDAALAALELADRIGARQVHSIVGVQPADVPTEDLLATLVENLRWAVPHLERAGIPLMVEALNGYDNPRYLLQKSADVIGVLNAVGSRWLKLQFDVYHVHRMEGHTVARLRATSPYIGHVQIADYPGRHEPGTGEIPFQGVLAALQDLRYGGFIGLEYVPKDDTEASLQWLPRFGRSRGCDVADLSL